MSQLTAIVDAVCALAPTGFTGSTLRGTSLKNQLDDADVPVRIVSTVGMQSARTKVTTLGGGGHVMTTEWTIVDIALLRNAGLGQGMKDIALGMESYLDAYHTAVRSLASPSWAVTDVRTRAQILEFPQGSGRFFDAVIATLTVNDIIQ